MTIRLTAISGFIPFLYHFYSYRNGMNPKMVCSSVLTSWETRCGGVISRCIVNKSERDYYC